MHRDYSSPDLLPIYRKQTLAVHELYLPSYARNNEITHILYSDHM